VAVPPWCVSNPEAQNATNSTLPMSLSGKSEMDSNDRGEGHIGRTVMRFSEVKSDHERA
jgi:hypothetical protein